MLSQERRDDRYVVGAFLFHLRRRRILRTFHKEKKTDRATYITRADQSRNNSPEDTRGSRVLDERIIAWKIYNRIFRGNPFELIIPDSSKEYSQNLLEYEISLQTSGYSL